jgi:hypothetical protein
MSIQTRRTRAFCEHKTCNNRVLLRASLLGSGTSRRDRRIHNPPQVANLPHELLVAAYDEFD